jgi:hypothetical protein
MIHRELDLVRAALEERFESQARTMLMLDQAVHHQREAAVSDAERLSAMAAEVSGLRLLLKDSIQKAAPDIDLVIAAERRMAHGRNIRAVEEETGKVREEMAAIRRSLGQQDGE